MVEESDHLIDGDILDAGNVVLVAEDEEIDHEIPVVPGTEGGVV